MYGLGPDKRPRWAILVPVAIIATAFLQSLLLLAIYYDVRLPAAVSWRAAPELHSTQALTRLPPFSSHDTDNYRWYTDAKLRQLAACTARGDCGPNADKIAIFASWHCHWAAYANYTGGEGVWCVGMMRSLERQGFTVLHGGDNDWRYIYHLHRQLGDMVRVIVADPGEEGHKGTFAQYQKSAAWPDGIPAWKWFRMTYYPTSESGIVGRAWMISAEPNLPRAQDVALRASGGVSWFATGYEALQVKSDPADFTFLGYGLAPAEYTAVVPWAQRPPRVYILAKQAHYFHNGHQAVYEPSFFTRAADELAAEFPGFEFVGGFADSRSADQRAAWPVPAVIRNLGLLDKHRFDEEYGHARLLLGLGSPPLSPSPYRALARAVPFANPHTVQNGRWTYQQHESMRDVPEPYAYQVEAFNYTSFVETIRSALRTPIEPLRFERMRRETADGRMRDWIMYDWRGLAAGILADRLAGNETQGNGAVGVFEL